MKRRPIPLEFEKPEHSNTNSFALHDAAIKSATTLMAVMNDVLKSPHLNAHFLAQQSGGLHQPVQSRPRSKTAPPTPLFEAPGVEPVELPGSFPVWPKSGSDTRSSMETTASSKHASIGCSMERPQSSPQPFLYAFHNDSQQPPLATSRSATDVRAMTGRASHERHQFSSAIAQNVPCASTLLASEHTAAPINGLSNGRPGHEQSGAPCVITAAPNHGESTIYRAFAPPSGGVLQGDAVQRKDSKTLLGQIARMRRSHESHVSSLKEAHDREVDSHISYIQFLESCATTTVRTQGQSQHGLKLDTSHVTGEVSELQSLDVSASTSLQSLDSTLEAQRRTSIESATAEAEALKRKLSLCRKTQSELGDIRRERDRFRDTSDKSERRIGQLKDIVRKSKDAEKAMKNKVQSLEASLLAANVERVDVLQGYHEACEQISKLHGKQLVLIKEREEALARLDSAKLYRMALSSDRGTQSAGLESNGSTAQDEALSRQVIDLQRIIAQRDSRIHELGAQVKDSGAKFEIRKLAAQLADTEAAREQYNSLLHAELRRQSKIVALNVSTGAPQVESEAAAAVAEKLNSKPGSENPEKRCEFLEKELKHCVSEIILYKLDIRGYRKDLKDANAQVKELQASRPRRPSTPDSLEAVAVDGKSATPQRRPRATSGLGISLQRSRTPTRPSTNRLSTPLQHSRGLASPSPKVVTPLELDKQLPKPPTESRDPSPNPALSPPITTLNRAETLRSLSESIISSYASRATPEQHQGQMPPLCRGRSADPPRAGSLRPDSYRAIDAIAVPISKYTPDMLKTPNMTITKGLVRT